MSETVNIVCYKWKTLSNGEHPLMLCICKDRKRKYQSIGVSINPIYWDFEKNKPKPKCPNRAYICKLITEKLNSVNTEIIRLHSENKDFTAKSVVDSHRKSHKSTTVEAVYYPFKAYKVAKLHKETAKRSLCKEDIERVLNFTSSNRFMLFPIDIFAFTYYCGGINFVDIANLTKDNIIEGRLVYKRLKTNKLIKIPIQPKAHAIINRYKKEESPYIFPILSSFHKSELQKANRIHKVISKVNERLKQIGNELNLPITLTTYCARHSQATVMKKAGVSTSIIREFMGHSSERVTQIYLDSFDNEQIDSAMKNLL